MQGTHIFRRDRMTQLIKCFPWSTRLHPHLTIAKKMRTFLEVEGKMGPIPQPTSSQHRPPQPDTSPNVRKGKATEKKKRVVPIKRFRANTAAEPTHNNLQGPQPISSLKRKQELQKIDQPPTLRRCPSS